MIIKNLARCFAQSVQAVAVIIVMTTVLVTVIPTTAGNFLSCKVKICPQHSREYHEAKFLHSHMSMVCFWGRIDPPLPLYLFSTHFGKAHNGPQLYLIQSFFLQFSLPFFYYKNFVYFCKKWKVLVSQKVGKNSILLFSVFGLPATNME